jgi:hypothetical protein
MYGLELFKAAHLVPIIYKICISQNATISRKQILSKTATCFDPYIGDFQAHTIPKAHIEEDNT